MQCGCRKAEIAKCSLLVQTVVRITYVFSKGRAEKCRKAGVQKTQTISNAEIQNCSAHAARASEMQLLLILYNSAVSAASRSQIVPVSLMCTRLCQVAAIASSTQTQASNVECPDRLGPRW